jgi:hypothetical protein
MELMDGVMGRAPVPAGPEEAVSTSPWSPQDLDFAKAPMPSIPPATAAAAFDPSEWEEDEEEDEEQEVRPPLPPPPPPAAAAAPPTTPAPPPPGVPSGQRPTRKPVIEGDEWEEVD